MLEESAASLAHFSWLLFYASTTLLCIAPLFNQAFLGTTLSSTLVYIWSRRNPDVRLSFLGLLTFKAPWLPWLLIAFNVVLHGHWPKDELCGIVVGHSTSMLELARLRSNLLTRPHSMVLLQRHLPINTQWLATYGPTTMVDTVVRARRVTYARHGRSSRSDQ